MIEDKIALSLKDIEKLKLQLKDIKKEMKDEEKNDSEEYLELKSGLKDLKAQVKDYEDSWKQDLLKDESYIKLRDMKIAKEEEIALANQKLFTHIVELPPKPFKMNLEHETGPLQVVIQPEMRLYLNGREEKRRAA